MEVLTRVKHLLEAVLGPEGPDGGQALERRGQVGEDRAPSCRGKDDMESVSQDPGRTGPPHVVSQDPGQRAPQHGVSQDPGRTGPQHGVSQSGPGTDRTTTWSQSVRTRDDP